eukprot:g2130.t1
MHCYYTSYYHRGRIRLVLQLTFLLVVSTSTPFRRFPLLHHFAFAEEHTNKTILSDNTITVPYEINKYLTFTWTVNDVASTSNINKNVKITLEFNNYREAGVGDDLYLAIGIASPLNVGEGTNKMISKKYPSYAVKGYSDQVRIVKLVTMTYPPGRKISNHSEIKTSFTRNKEQAKITLEGYKLGDNLFRPLSQDYVTMIWSYGERGKKHIKRGFFDFNFKALKGEDKLDLNLLFRSLHGGSMATIWALTTLIGGAFARYGRSNKNWIKYHMVFQLIATFLTLPLTILSYITKYESHYNTTHGQCGLVFSLLATLQGTLGSFVHGAFQHRGGFIGNPILMWKLRKFHRALGKALLVFATCQIILGIDTLCSCVLNSSYGIGFIIYSIIAWLSVLVLEYRHQVGITEQIKAHGKHDYSTHLQYLGKEDLRRDNWIYLHLVAACDEALHEINFTSRIALMKFMKKTDPTAAVQMKYLVCKHWRGHRSLRNDVLLDFLKFIKTDLCPKDSPKHMNLCIFIDERIEFIMNNETNEENIKHVFESNYWPVGVFVPNSPYIERDATNQGGISKPRSMTHLGIPSRKTLYFHEAEQAFEEIKSISRSNNTMHQNVGVVDKGNVKDQNKEGKTESDEKKKHRGGGGGGGEIPTVELGTINPFFGQESHLPPGLTETREEGGGDVKI